MPQWQGKSKGNKLGYKIFVFVIRYLGTLPAYILLRFVAFYFFLFSTSSTPHIYAYFRHRLGYGRIRAALNVYANYYVFGQTLLDKVIVMAGIENNFTYDFDGEEHLHRIVEQGRGGILLSGHVGNWEAAGHLLRRLNTRVNVVMYDGEHEQIKEYLEQVTGGPNFRVIVVKEDLGHVYAIGDALQNNELVCLHADRFTDGSKTVTRQFLGAPAHFPAGPFVLASTFKVPVSIVFAFKESSRHYHFYGSPLVTLQDAPDRAAAIDNLIDTFVVNLEQMVRKYPKQWFNYYNFWKDISTS